MKATLLSLVVLLLCTACANSPVENFAVSAGPVKNAIVYNEPGRFAGWPANNGI